MARQVEKKRGRLVMAKGVRFSCRQCGDCCRETPVSLTPGEVERYAERDWTELLGVPGPVSVQVRAAGRVTHYLRHQANGECIFLAPDSQCRIHARYGAEDKPLVCRAYPFSFVPAADEARAMASASFSCSAVAAGDGARLANHRASLEDRFGDVTELGMLPAKTQLPYQGHLVYPRDEVELLFELLLEELEDARRPFPERILAVGKFLSLLTSSAFPSLGTRTTRKQVTSFMRGIRSQVERGLLRPASQRPPLPQRLLFRQVLAMTARRHPASLLTAGVVRRTVHRFGNLLAGLTYMAGTGALLPLGRERRVVLGEVRRTAPEADPGAPAADGALTRYFVAKVSGRFIYDPEMRVRAVLPALGLLMRQYPLILLFARAACQARGGEALTSDDYASALRTADHNFGRVPFEAGPLGGVRARLLADVEASFGFVDWCARRPGAAPGQPPALEAQAGS